MKAALERRLQAQGEKVSEELYSVNSLDDMLYLIDSEEEIDLSLVRFEGWPFAEIKIYGGRYQGELTPEMAKALSDFVQSLKKAYFVYRTGSANLQSFRAQDQALFDGITFRVDEGCTEILAKLNTLLENLNGEILKEAIRNMDSKHIALVTAFLGTLMIGSCSFNDWDTRHIQLEESKDANATLLEVQRQTIEAQETASESTQKILGAMARHLPKEEVERLSRFKSEVDSGYLGIVRAASDADHISISGKELRREDIQDITAKDRVTTRSRNVTESVIIEYVKNSLKNLEVNVNIVSEEFPDRNITLQFPVGNLSTPAEEMLYTALRKNRRIKARIQYMALVNDRNGTFERGTLMDVLDLAPYASSDATDNEVGAEK